MKMSKIFGLFLVAYQLRITCCLEVARAKRQTEDKATLQATVSAMRRKDCNAPRNGDYDLNYQGQVNTSTFEDESDNPFFGYVNDALFHTPTYQAYRALWPLFNPDVTAPDPIDADKETKIDAFLDAVMNTEVFRIAWMYLQQKDKASRDYTTFKGQLKTLWFDLYARNHKDTLGSSGFEHVFLGEFKMKGDRAIVGGQHDWYRFWTLEKEGAINYHGWIEHYGYQWDAKWRKKIGGFFVGTTVELDFSICTICALISPNGGKCKYSINGHDIISVNYVKDGYLRTCYPKIN